jgi:hypothetical protein
MSVPALDPLVAAVLRASLSILFAAAAWHKLRDVAAFRAALRGYQLMPEALVSPAATAVVLAENSVAGALWLPASAELAGALAASLLAAYSLAIGLNLARGRRRIDCGCLGPASDQPLSAALLVRNAVLWLGSLALLLPTSSRAFHWGVDAPALFGGVATGVLLFLATNQLVALKPQDVQRGGVS